MGCICSSTPIDAISDGVSDGIILFSMNYDDIKPGWDIPKHATNSDISVNSKRTYAPHLRCSKFARGHGSIPYNAYPLPLTKEFGEAYKTLIIGDGTMHIYKKGGFMKMHTDRYQGNLNGLHHTHTLVVFSNNGYRGGGFFICNRVIKATGQCTAIAFPISMKHEILHVTEGIRKSFSFPLYTAKPSIPRRIEQQLFGDIDNTCCGSMPVLED